MATLAECPVCHKKQSIKNKVCDCGENLDNAKKNKRVRYHIVYRKDGKQVWKSLSSFEGMSPYSIEDAHDIEAKFRVAKRENKLDIFEPKKEATMTFRELSDWYLELESVKDLASYKTAVGYLKKFNSEFGNRIVNTIKLNDLKNLQVKRKREGLKPKTIDDEVGYARTMIINAFDNDIIGGDTLKVFRKVKNVLKRNSNARDRVLGVKEYETLLTRSPRHLKEILITGYWTGMRRAEITGLAWDRIDLPNRMIHLEALDTKDAEARDVPIAKDVYELFKSIPRPIHGGHVFLYNGKPIQDFYTALKRACGKAKIPWGQDVKNGFVFHDFRHGFVTDMRKAGISKNVRTSITGHANSDMDARYDKIDDEDKHQAMERLTAYRLNVRQSVSFTASHDA